MALSNDLAALIGFALESLFYGFYCMLFLASTTVLLWWRRKHRSFNLPMVVANFALFLCCTTHYAIEFNHFYTTLAATGVNKFADETKPLMAADILISLTDMLGDFVLIYRMWHVWGRNYYLIILPLLLAVSGFACACGVIHVLLTSNPAAPVAPPSLVPLGQATYILPLCTNGIVTILIVGRIWWLSRGVSSFVKLPSSSDAVRRVMIIVSESGALYLVTQLIFVVLFSIRHPAQAIMGVVSVQVYGIAPTIIILGVELGFTSDEIISHASSTRLDFSRASRRPISSLPTGTKNSGHTGTTAAASDREYMGEMKLSQLKRPDTHEDAGEYDDEV